MFKKICFFLLLPAATFAQSLNLSVDDHTAGNGYTTFRLADHNVKFSRTVIEFLSSGTRFNAFATYGVTPDLAGIGVIQNTVDGPGIVLMDTGGDTLAAYPTISLSFDDPSLAIYPLNSGSALIRNNIANFTLYDSFGEIITSGSGSSQSEEGESISEVAMDRDTKTIVIYVPKIKGDGNFGSQASILRENSSAENIYFSSDREITYGGVSGNGQFVILITARQGTDDRVMIMDRFGNELNTISTDEDLVAARLTADGSHVTLRSDRRVLVYSTLGGERIGSTSFRSPLIHAQYFPEDKTIVGITGSYVENTGIIKDIEFHAIHLEQREIARRELAGALGTASKIGMRFRRTGTGSYRLLGASKIINMSAGF